MFFVRDLKIINIMNKSNYYIYIVSNWNNKVIYIGVTNDLERRIHEHKNKLFKGFSQKYNLNKLVYFEFSSDIKSANTREKEIKKWRREKKNKLIETINPDWEDLLIKADLKISQSNEKCILLRNDNPHITGLIVSAGLSSRIGNFKPLIEYGGKTFLSNIIDKLLTVCDNVIVVIGHNADAIETLISNNVNYQGRVNCVYNKEYEKGMFTSLQRGVQECTNTNWIVYHQVDQPNLPINFYKEFVNQIDDHFNWIQPVYNERKGHPILICNKIISEILVANYESNLREISLKKEFSKKLWDCKYEEIHTDIDTLKDLHKLK
jgi:putative endonuclease